MKITREQFMQRAQRILKTSKDSHSAITRLAEDATYVKAIEELTEHDTELARLCREADLATQEPLLRIVKYLSNKLEC